MNSSVQRRVLVVDDNASLAENLSEILQDASYFVRTVPSCEAARAVAREGFEIALVDLLLPDGDGTLLARWLKEQQPDSEVVLLTGHASVESAAAAVRAGASAYLIKPCPPDELLLTVDRAMRQVHLLRERRELARRAQTAEKLAAVGTLTAGLSHEIRNPLNAAGLQLSVLERRIRKLAAPETVEPLLQPLALVRDEIRRLDHILEDFLQFARPREIEARSVEMGRLLGSVLDLLQGDAERRGVNLVRPDGAIPDVGGDEGRLRQVFMNLFLNAMEAAGRGGTVRVATATVSGMLWLSIEDSGPGVAQELRERIFEPFFTTKQTGSGLGLAIVHAIVTQHGGSINLETSELGGARFVIRLPLAS